MSIWDLAFFGLIAFSVSKFCHRSYEIEKTWMTFWIKYSEYADISENEI